MIQLYYLLSLESFNFSQTVSATKFTADLFEFELRPDIIAVKVDIS